MKRLAVALAAIAVLIGMVLPATSQAAPPGFITILFGRTQFVSINGSSCQPLPNTVDLNQVASDMAARGLTGVGNVIVNRTQETGLFCARDGLSLHPGWDWLSQRQAQGWRFISASLDYPNMTTLAYPEQVRQSCGSLEAFTSHSIVGAQGMFAFPNDKSTAAIQIDPVSTCFDFGRKYGPGLNTQSQMTAPWFASTLSVGGGKCNDITLPCYTAPAPLRYYSPDALAASMNVAPGSWFDIQFYRFVTGSFSGTHSSWDCTSPDWRQHWVSRNELYCYGDFLQVMDAAQAAVASGAVVTDPHSVALAWGRGRRPHRRRVRPRAPRRRVPTARSRWGPARSSATTSTTLRVRGKPSRRYRSRGTAASRSRGGSRTTATPRISSGCEGRGRRRDSA